MSKDKFKVTVDVLPELSFNQLRPLEQVDFGGPTSVMAGVPHPSIEFRTCVRPAEGGQVHMQFRGPAALMGNLIGAHEVTEDDEEMCDDWTEWTRVW